VRAVRGTSSSAFPFFFLGGMVYSVEEPLSEGYKCHEVIALYSVHFLVLIAAYFYLKFDIKEWK